MTLSLTDPQRARPAQLLPSGLGRLSSLAPATVARGLYPAFPRTRQALCQLKGFRVDTLDFFRHPWGLLPGDQEDDGMKTGVRQGKGTASPSGRHPPGLSLSASASAPRAHRPFLRPLRKFLPSPVSFLSPRSPYASSRLCVGLKTACFYTRKVRSTQTCAVRPCTRD